MPNCRLRLSTTLPFSITQTGVSYKIPSTSSRAGISEAATSAASPAQSSPSDTMSSGAFHDGKWRSRYWRMRVERFVAKRSLAFVVPSGDVPETIRTCRIQREVSLLQCTQAVGERLQTRSVVSQRILQRIIAPPEIDFDTERIGAGCLPAPQPTPTRASSA